MIRDKIWLLDLFHTTLSHHSNHVSNKNLTTGENLFTFYLLFVGGGVVSIFYFYKMSKIHYFILGGGYYFIFTSIFTLCIFLIPSSSSEFIIWDFHWNWTSSFTISYNSSLLISKFLSLLSESVLIFVFEW